MEYRWEGDMLVPVAEKKRKRRQKKSRPLAVEGGPAEYRRYLKSKQWKARRKEALEHYGHRCADCGRKERLQVHHKTYAHVGNERMEDLTVLCKWCHADHHKQRDDRGDFISRRYEAFVRTMG